MTLRAFLNRFNVYCSDNRLCIYLNENNDQARYAKVLVMMAPWDKLKPLKIGLRSSEAFLIKGTSTVPNEVNGF